MTAQARENLLYQEEEVWMAAEPLNPFLKLRNDIQFFSPSTLSSLPIKKSLQNIGLQGFTILVCGATCTTGNFQ